jgi:hypothetical protein
VAGIGKQSQGMRAKTGDGLDHNEDQGCNHRPTEDATGSAIGTVRVRMHSFQFTRERAAVKIA